MIKKITVIGAGIMGSGIAKSIFKYGFDVTIFDSNEDQLIKTCEELKKGARRGVDPDKIHKAESLEASIKEADLVIEAVIEDLDVKCQLFREMGKLAAGDTIFASNTSSLDICVMAEASGRPERFLGLHFFNPAFLMRLVEVVKSPLLSDEAERDVSTFLKEIKKRGVNCKPSPGFIVNRILIPVMNEAFCILENRGDKSIIEMANDIDSSIMNEQIFLIGLFNLVDLTGLDTTMSVAQRIFHGFNDNPRYTPSLLLKEYVDNGFCGRKRERGIYYYGNKKNDPDLNPRLDHSKMEIKYIENPTFDTLNLIAVIVNESLRLLEEGIAENYTDIDFCMESGAHWPLGPFGLAKKIGLEVIAKKINLLYNESDNNKRYEPCPLLKNLPDDLNDFFYKLV